MAGSLSRWAGLLRLAVIPAVAILACQPAHAQSGFGSGVGVGVAVNGACLAGQCPPVATPANTNETLPYSFNVTASTGDVFFINGNISVGTDGFSQHAGEIFLVKYLGNGSSLANVPSQADTLTIDLFLNAATSASSLNNTNPFAVTFGPTIAASSSASLSAIVNGVRFPRIGPFSPPGSFSHSDTMTVPGGGQVAADSTYTATFGAGSPVGSFMLLGFNNGNPNGLFSSILPTARTSSQNSAGGFPTVTAFGTIINNLGQAATSCNLTQPSGVPATFGFQTTDPTTNAVTGTFNAPVNIPAGASQSFVFAVTPTSTFSRDIPINFSCLDASSNASVVPAASIAGLNSFLLTASSTPLPDMLSIAATPSNDGSLRLPSTTGGAAFSSAAINIAAAGTTTVTPSFTPFGQSPRSLPLGLSICQSNPSTGACTNPTTPAASATVTTTTNQTVTFSIFVQGQGQAVPFDPANNRIHLIATQGSIPVGQASVAVQTP